MSKQGVTPRDVRYVAELARLRMSDEDIECFVPQLNTILRYMEKLNELDTKEVTPLTNPVDLADVFREDVVRPSLARDKALASAPAVVDGLFQVPRIIEDS